jgi:hypothetical protein
VSAGGVEGELADEGSLIRFSGDLI